MTRYPDPVRSYAVLVGVSRHTNPDLPDIPAVGNNLTDLQQLLADPVVGSFTAAQVAVVAQPGHRAEIGDAVGRAARAATDVLLVYYAGHGLLDSRSRLHLALSGSDPGRPEWSALPFDILRQELADSAADTRILILDCCFSGRAFEAMADMSTVVVGQVEADGTYTIASSSANEPSFAPAGHRNTAFTAALLATAGTGPARTLDELYQGIDQHLLRNSHPRPRRRSVDRAGDLVLFNAQRRGARPRARFSVDDQGQIVVNEVQHWFRLDSRGANLTEAETWWRRNALAENPQAMYRLAEILELRMEGHDAETWYRRGAEAGYLLAMCRLAELLDQKEDPEAGLWWRRAADAGSHHAMIAIGNRCLEQGFFEDAEAWWRRAADAGSRRAARTLVNHYEQHGPPGAAERWRRHIADAGPEPVAELTIRAN